MGAREYKIGPTIEKQNRFVAEYVKDRNAKEAAIRAGYAKAGAAAASRRLMQNPRVLHEIENISKKIDFPKLTSKEISDFLTFVLRNGDPKNACCLEAHDQKNVFPVELRVFAAYVLANIGRDINE